MKYVTLDIETFLNTVTMFLNTMERIEATDSIDAYMDAVDELAKAVAAELTSDCSGWVVRFPGYPRYEIRRLDTNCTNPWLLRERTLIEGAA